jgi:hypothetical protein
LVYDQLGVTLDIKPSDPKLGGDVQSVDKCLILSNIVRDWKMDSDHIPYAHANRGDDDESYPDSALHQRPIQIHCPILLLHQGWCHLGLDPFYNKICQHLGLDGLPRSIGDALSHEFNCPLGNSSHHLTTLDHLPKREG